MLLLQGVITLCLTFEGLSSTKAKSWERKITRNTLYGVTVFKKEFSIFPVCPTVCFRHSSCKLFTFNPSTGTCMGFSSFTTKKVEVSSTPLFDYFAQVGTSVYTHDALWNVTFAVYKTMKNWHDARKVCISDGARLITFDNKGKTKIKSHIDTDKYWIGLSDIQKENTWVWENGKQFDKGNWSYSLNNYDGAAGGSHRTNADCATWVSSIDHINDCSCVKSNRYFICEKA